MRADRLLSILLLLQARGRMTAGELAERLEVSQRTIYRDMDALSAAGVPVYAERGGGGGCFLSPEYRTDLTGMSEAEIRTLFLAQPPRVLSDLGLLGAAEGALAKLLAALPSGQHRDAESGRGRIHVDAGGWRPSEEAFPFLPQLQEAIWRERRLRLRYGREEGAATERVVDPLGLVAKGSIWYLVGAAEGELRTYRVSRVWGAEIMDEPCARPPGFDLAAYWEESKSRFVAALPSYPVVLRVAPQVLAQVRRGGRWSRVEWVEPPDEEGWAWVHVRFELEEDARAHVLSFGAQVEVLEPRELREQVIGLAGSIVEFYARKPADARSG